MSLGAIRLAWETLSAVRQARRFGRSHPASVRVCWDLDNTLVDSGRLIHAGTPLREAVIDAEPVPKMLEFYEALRAKLPDAQHFILSARMSSMRRDTLVWLQRHGLTPQDGAVCFVPQAKAKVKVWRQLARDGQLVIVDDLSYNHESDSPDVYHELVHIAQRTARVYIGLEQIGQIAADSIAVDAAACSTVQALAQASQDDLAAERTARL